MARFRLRFLLQEFDIVGPEVILGRSPECNITIEDPLVSRQHSRIRVDGDKAFVSDLGSRNGVRVNGRLIEGECPVKDGDRIRLGTQELVFSVVHRKAREARTTGYMRVCGSCSTPYPEQAPQCPHCGASDPQDEDTISGLLVAPKRSWTFQLLGEVIERALSSGRSSEAERLLRRAAKEVDERQVAGELLAPDQISTITGFAIRLAGLEGRADWVSWALRVHRRQAIMPSSEVIDALEALDGEAAAAMSASVESFVAWWRDTSPDGPSGDLAGLSRLEKLKR